MLNTYVHRLNELRNVKLVTPQTCSKVVHAVHHVSDVDVRANETGGNHRSIVRRRFIEVVGLSELRATRLDPATGGEQHPSACSLVVREAGFERSEEVKLCVLSTHQLSDPNLHIRAPRLTRISTSKTWRGGFGEPVLQGELGI